MIKFDDKLLSQNLRTPSILSGLIAGPNEFLEEQR